MFPLFLTLAVLSIGALVAGLILLLLRRGRVTRVAGPEVGEQVMSNDAVPKPGEVTVTETKASAFAGTGARVHVEGEIYLAEAKQAWTERCWTDALTSLLILLGFMGPFLFGALAILTGFDNKLPGIAALALAIWVVARLARELAKA